MATYGYTTSTGTYRGAKATTAVPYRVERVINFDSATIGFVNASADVIQAIAVPANSTILRAGGSVLTVDSGGGTLSVGLGGSTGYFVSAGAVASAIPLTNANPAAKEIGSAPDTIDLLVVASAFTTLKVVVWAWIAPNADVTTISGTAAVGTLSSATTI